MASLVCLMAAAVGKSNQTLPTQLSIIRALWSRMMLSNAAFLPECLRVSHASKRTKKKKRGSTPLTTAGCFKVKCCSNGVRKRKHSAGWVASDSPLTAEQEES